MCHDYVATDRDKMTINLQDEVKNSYDRWFVVRRSTLFQLHGELSSCRSYNQPRPMLILCLTGILNSFGSQVFDPMLLHSLVCVASTIVETCRYKAMVFSLCSCVQWLPKSSIASCKWLCHHHGCSHVCHHYCHNTTFCDHYHMPLLLACSAQA